MHLLRIHAIALGAMFLVGPAAAQVNIGIWAVSYTHLDVYKRQGG